MEIDHNKDLITVSTSLTEGNEVKKPVTTSRMALAGHCATDENLYKGIADSLETHVASDFQQPGSSLTRQEVLQRRINLIEELVSEYKTQSKHLRDELLLQHHYLDSSTRKYTLIQGPGDVSDEKDISLDDAFLNGLWAQGWGEVIPHALEVERKALRATQDQGRIGYKTLEDSVREAKQHFLENGLHSVARRESSSHSSWCQEMDKHDAIAMICGENHSYFVRSRGVSLGRRVAEGKKEKHGESIDINLGEEAFGHLGAISRCQARVLFDVDTKFRIKNVGQRIIFVDGEMVEPGQTASLCHLSLISIATVSLLFAVNQRAIDRIEGA
eukprot:jgi/Picsp_1/6555/NSC_03898-R1_microspherule protein